MVIQHTIERTIQTIRDRVCPPTIRVIAHADDRRVKIRRRFGKEASWLGDEPHGHAIEMNRDGVADGGRDGRQRALRETTANVDEVQTETVVSGGKVVQGPRRRNGLRECVGRAGPRAHMKADADEVGLTGAGGGKNRRPFTGVGAEFVAERALRVGIVSVNAQHKAGVGRRGHYLFEFMHRIKGHSAYASGGGVPKVTGAFVWVGINDAFGISRMRKDSVDLRGTSAIKVGAKVGERCEECGVRVAFDSIIGFYGGQLRLPKAVETTDFGGLVYVKRCFLVTMTRDVFQICCGGYIM